MTWHIGTLEDRFPLGTGVIGLRFSVPTWPGHIPGQHIDLRLTAPDGYQATRSYSIANAPYEKNIVELGVLVLPDGEVSPYLETMKIGGAVEMRGPLGGHFIWDSASSDPLLMIGGGTGIVPLVSMIRDFREQKNTNTAILLGSFRTKEKILYGQELREYEKNNPSFHFTATLTDTVPENWKGYTGYISPQMIQETFGSHLKEHPSLYICGPTKFVEVAASQLIQLGVAAERIKTERFG